MKLEHTQAKRLYDSIRRIAGEEKAVQILEQLPLSKTPSDNKKYEWACSSCKLLEEHFDAQTVTAIRKGCICKPSPALVKQLKALWTQSKNLDDFCSSADSYINKADENTIWLCYPQCYCPFIKRSTKPVGVRWCDCSLGYAEALFQEVFGRSVSAQLLESIAAGDERCIISVTMQ